MKRPAARMVGNKGYSTFLSTEEEAASCTSHDHVTFTLDAIWTYTDPSIAGLSRSVCRNTSADGRVKTACKVPTQIDFASLGMMNG